jgi:hypothetical protein
MGWNMTERIDAQQMSLGLLMEAAQAQQRLGQDSLERLAAHTRDLDAIVREEIRRTLAEELGSLASESRGAAQSLRRLRRAANLRTFLWAITAAAVCSAIAMGEAWWLIPSPRELTALRARRDALAASVARLRRQGGSIDLRRCGARARLCVRVDRRAPAYGKDADYLIVKGD